MGIMGQKTEEPRGFWQAADGSGTAERLTESRNVRRPSSVLADGSAVLYSESSDVMMLTLSAPRRVLPIVHTPALGQSGVVSPDGRWIAFASVDSGASQIFVRPFPNTTEARSQISIGGGSQPRWSRDGRELFFLAPDGTLCGRRSKSNMAGRHAWSRRRPQRARRRQHQPAQLRRHTGWPAIPRRQRLSGAPTPAPHIVVVQN
jgi:Tol biopolymer transport system component